MTDRRFILIDSKDRFLGTSGNFRYNLNGLGVLSCKSYKINKATIPHSWHAIPAQTFVLTESGGDKNVNFPGGSYTTTSMIAQFIASINAAAPLGTYTLTFDVNTSQFTFSSGGQSFRLNFTNPTIKPRYNLGVALGFISVGGDPIVPPIIDPETSSLTGAFFANLSPISELYIECSELDNSTTAFFNRNRSSIVASVQVLSDYGNYVNWSDQTDNYFPLSDSFSESFSVRLLDSYGDVVNLQGQDWSFEIYMQVTGQ